MKLSVEVGGIATLGLVALAAVSCAQQSYTARLQDCIIQARYGDGGSYDARLAEYKSCADDVDRDAGLAIQTPAQEKK